MSDFFIFLDSQNSIDNSGNPADSEFTINLNFDSYSNPYISLEEICFQNLNYPINSNYNTIIIEENGTSTISVNLTQQNYDGNSFATEIASKLNTASVEGITYTCSFDTNTRKLTLSADGANTYQILTGTSCLRELGLNLPQTAAVNNAEFPHPVRLDGSHYIDVISNIPVNNISSSGRTNILARIFLTAPFGSLQTFENSNTDKIRFNSQHFSSISLRLVDDRNNLFLLPDNADVSYTLKLTI